MTVLLGIVLLLCTMALLIHGAIRAMRRGP
jgi:hypothetical protein